MMKQSEDIRQCIEVCWECRNLCQSVLFNHCLDMGGRHVESGHVKVMTDCIQICQIAADAMVRRSSLHADICTACATVCEACAESCEKLGGQEMQHCAEICRRCAASCREMSSMQTGAAAGITSEDHIMA